ncbi:hypothetical protein D3C85_632500 [compost metagenome]
MEWTPYFKGFVALLIKRRKLAGTALCRSNWADHSCHRRKLVGERHYHGAGEFAPSFTS